MASYPPPEEILTIFNGSLYDFSTTGLTIAEGDERYLKLNGGIVSGSVLFNAGLQSVSNIQISDNYGITNISNNKINFNTSNIDFLINNLSVFTLTASGPSYTNINLTTTGYLGNGGDEKIQFSSNSIDLQVEGISEFLLTSTTATFGTNLLIPATGNIGNSSNTRTIYNTSSIDHQISGVSELILTASDATFGTNIIMPGSSYIGLGASSTRIEQASGVQRFYIGNNNYFTIDSLRFTFGLNSFELLDGTLIQSGSTQTGLQYNSSGITYKYANVTKAIFSSSNLTLTDLDLVVPAGKTITAQNTTDATSTSSGAIICSGGVGIAKSLYVGTTTDSTSATTGAIISSGGIATNKSLWAQTGINVPNGQGITNVANNSTTWNTSKIISKISSSQVHEFTSTDSTLAVNLQCPSLNFTTGNGISSLSYYKLENGSALVVGNIVNSAAANFFASGFATSGLPKYSRMGKQVVINFPNISGTTSGTASYAQYTIPNSDYHPSTQLYGVYLGYNGTTYAQCTWGLSSGGLLRMYYGVFNGNYPSGTASVQIFEFTITFNIA